MMQHPVALETETQRITAGRLFLSADVVQFYY